jgi:aminopeptidase-like protein
MTGTQADERLGAKLFAIVEELYPICRSITGDGMRETLRRLQRRIPLVLHEIPTGTQVFDWTVPREWNIRDAYVMDSRGQRVIDFQRSNLHVVNYSVPVHRRMTLAELREHLHTIPEQPDRIPYITSYYAERWGFCLAHQDVAALTEDEYEVCIDSRLEPGHLTFGECIIPGTSTEEVLISAHTCHPSLANDNLSGVAVATLLAQHIARSPRRYTYRFLFIPGTIGSIAWLARHPDCASRIKHGLVLSCVGDPGGLTYKRSRRGTAAIDRAAEHVLEHHGGTFEIQDFVPYGNDERQYCSPGFDLPVGCLSRTPPERYPEYHTSADDLSLVRPEYLADSLAACQRIVDVLERDRTYVNLNPCCEPQLGKRGLYRATGGQDHLPGREMALLWVLNLSDGRHTLLDIAERAAMDFAVIERAASDLAAAGLLEDRPMNGNGRRRSRQTPESAVPIPPHSIPVAEALT